MVDGQPAPVGDVGGVFFDVAGRSAVFICSAPTPTTKTGRYEFTAVKQHGVWRFSRWVVAIDQRQPRGAQ